MAVVCAAAGLLAAGCSRGGHGHDHASAADRSGAAATDARLAITLAGGGVDLKPDRGIAVTAAAGTITRVVVHNVGDSVTGTLNAAGTVWRSGWALDVSRHYTVIASAAGPSGKRVTQSSSLRIPVSHLIGGTASPSAQTRVRCSCG
jgi:hypothetical protein